MKKKFLILTDSVGNPHPFLKKDATSLEDTFPFLIKNKYNKSQFHQISLGHALSVVLMNQARGYIQTWKPDYIIILAGINDCSPKFIAETEKKFLFKYMLINRMPDKIREFFKNKIVNNKKLTLIRSKPRIDTSKFINEISGFERAFKNSKIFWFEIFYGNNNEQTSKLMSKNISLYNKIINNFKNIKLIHTKKDLLKKKGIAKDDIHLNKNGHKLLADKILSNLNN
jgi:lysophospholipase L1-like esterase